MSGNNDKGVVWFFIVMLALLFIAKATEKKGPVVDYNELKSNSRLKTTMDIERIEAQRAINNESPLSEDEIQIISEHNVSEEYRRLKQR